MSSSKLSHAQNQDHPVEVDPEYQEEQLGVGEELAETTKLLTPWAISFMFHFSLVLLALFVIWSSSAVSEGESVVPVMNHQKEIKPKIEKMRPPDLPTVPNVNRIVRQPTLKRGNPLSEPSEASPSPLSTIGASGSPSSFGHPDGTDADGAGFMSIGLGSAERVVYVVDASGSMVESLPFVINKLKESIRGMKGRAHRFAIIFYQKDSAVEVYDSSMGLTRGLKKANAENKGKVFEWLRQKGRLTPSGSSNPLVALELAMSYQPDAIYLLSDNITGSGQYAIHRDELLETISNIQNNIEKNNGKSIKIHTIQFLSEDPLETLEMVARENDGQFKYISPAFVGLQ